jgi:hypothetical protein
MTRNQERNRMGKHGGKDMASWKPGSDPKGAKEFESPGDFGVPEGDAPSLDRDYVSRNTKRSDPGAAVPRSGEDIGVRTTGAGGPATGDGSSSGGDIDPDIVGVGTGGTGVSMSGPTGRSDAADSDGSSREFASGGPAEGRNQTGVHHVGGNKRVHGTTVDREPADIASVPQFEGADSFTNPRAHDGASELDDSFVGEISGGEAFGEDNPMPPSPDNNVGEDPTDPDIDHPAR